MNEIKRILDHLDKTVPDWKTNVLDSCDLYYLNDPDYQKNITDLITKIRDCKKAENTAAIQELITLINHRKFYELLDYFVESSLVHYRNLEPLKTANTSSQDKIRQFLEDVFQNYILRFDPQIFSRFELYNLHSKDEIKSALQSLDSLTDYYVRHLYAKTYMAEDFQDETGLSVELCSFYAELTDKHFQEIKQNLLLQGIDKCQMLMEKPEES